MKLNVTMEAIEDLGAIKKYIREELSNPSAANRISAKIVKSYKSLKKTPYIGKSLSSVVDVRTEYRFLVCENYLIFYDIENNTVRIIRIIDGRRDYCRMMFGVNINDVLIDNNILE